MTSGAPPSADEIAAAWWTSLTQAERAEALKAAAWTAAGTDGPSVSDAWQIYKLRSHTAAAGRESLRYVALIGRYGLAPCVFDMQTRTQIESYPSLAECEQRAIVLNRER
jgi:hypothetical protein